MVYDPNNPMLLLATTCTRTDTRPLETTDVCGVNAIGTVIFLKAVPAHCLRARGRDWANSLAGTVLEMEEMWRL